MKPVETVVALSAAVYLGFWLIALYQRFVRIRASYTSGLHFTCLFCKSGRQTEWDRAYFPPRAVMKPCAECNGTGTMDDPTFTRIIERWRQEGFLAVPKVLAPVIGIGAIIEAWNSQDIPSGARGLVCLVIGFVAMIFLLRIRQPILDVAYGFFIDHRKKHSLSEEESSYANN